MTTETIVDMETEQAERNGIDIKFPGPKSRWTWVAGNVEELNASLAEECEITIEEIKCELKKMENDSFVTCAATQDLPYYSSLQVC